MIVTIGNNTFRRAWLRSAARPMPFAGAVMKQPCCISWRAWTRVTTTVSESWCSDRASTGQDEMAGHVEHGPATLSFHEGQGDNAEEGRYQLQETAQ